MDLFYNRYPDRADLGGGADVYERWGSGMTEWREELIEKMVRAMQHIEPNNNLMIDELARAALAVAEPVIREECAKIADREANVNTVFEKSDFLDGIVFGARVIAKAIR